MKRNFETVLKQLGEKIDEKTSIRMRKILNGVENPSLDTLDRLAILAGFQDWKSLKKTFNDQVEVSKK
jgi:hypothetical protein